MARPTTGRDLSYVDRTHVISDIRNLQHAVFSNHGKRFVLRSHKAASHTRDHSISILDTTHGEVGGHAINSDSFIANQAGGVRSHSLCRSKESC